jgi:hypothetical protein
VDGRGEGTLRTHSFFSELVRAVAGVPDQGSPVADVATGSSDPEIQALENKINELLGVLRTSGVIAS